jgi:hypothetical protein
MVVAELEASAALVCRAGGEELRYLSVLIQDDDFGSFKGLEVLDGSQGDHYTRCGVTFSLFWVGDVSWGLGELDGVVSFDFFLEK